MVLLVDLLCRIDNGHTVIVKKSNGEEFIGSVSEFKNNRVDLHRLIVDNISAVCGAINVTTMKD